jgi:hypothetical protein
MWLVRSMRRFLGRGFRCEMLVVTVYPRFANFTLAVVPKSSSAMP